MWICLNDGFLSAVAADPARLPKADRKRIGGQRPLCVRARNADHLRALFPDYTVYEWKGRDYPARIFIGADQFAAFVAGRAVNITATNFKDSVADNELHDAYMGIWSVMHRYQHGAYNRGAYDPLQSSFYDRFTGPPGEPRDMDDAGQPVDWDMDDEPCSTPGCTEDYPCVNCLIDAIHGPDDRTEAELLEAADDKHAAQMMDFGPEERVADCDRRPPLDTYDENRNEDRYGPYDSGDEADDDDTAESHRRVAP